MHDLQLVGFTTDRRGLIFRTRAGPRPEASFVVPITDELIELVTQLADGQAPPAEVADGSARSNEAGAEAPAAEPDPQRPRSQMSVRDIQARLRAGEPTARIAAEAGVDEDWIERFAPPVRAEQQQIVARALDCHLRRARSAPSAVPLRRAVGMALADKGIAYTVAAYEAAWSARLLGHDRWAVSFTYHHRGRERTATWAYDAGEDALTTTDRAAAQLGYVAPGEAVEDHGAPIDGIVGDPGAAPARPEEPAPPEQVPATKAPARKAGAKGTPAKKPAPKGTAAKRSGATKSAPKRAAPTRAVPKKSGAKTSGAKKSAPKGTAAKRSGAKKPAPKRAAAKKAVPKKAAARRPKDTVVVKTSPPRPAPAEQRPAEPTPPPATGAVDVPTDRRLPDEPPRAGTVPVAGPLAHRAPAPGANGRPHDADARPEPSSNGADPASARRARAAQRNASTVHFRSGSAAPVRTAGEATPPRPADERPVADDRSGPDRGGANGAARPTTRRRRQLRAR